MPNYDALMKKARRTNAARDRIDRSNGHAAPGENGDGPPGLENLMLLRTAMMAVESGIKCDDWSCVAEGLAMLEQLHPRLDPEGRSYPPAGA